MHREETDYYELTIIRYVQDKSNATGAIKKIRDKECKEAGTMQDLSKRNYLIL